jgi:hypothetical protein
MEAQFKIGVRGWKKRLPKGEQEKNRKPPEISKLLNKERKTIPNGKGPWVGPVWGTKASKASLLTLCCIESRSVVVLVALSLP